MKKLVILISLLILSTIGFCQVNPNNHYVKGYHKSNGTYVQGHYRTNPNSTNRDNYSTYPNVNPYTGKIGTVAPDNNYSATTLEIPGANSISYSRTYSKLFDNDKASTEESRREMRDAFKAGIDYQKKQDKFREELNELANKDQSVFDSNPLNALYEMQVKEILRKYEIEKVESEILYSPFDITRPANAKTYNVSSVYTVTK
jgi:hypothetical protein